MYNIQVPVCNIHMYLSYVQYGTHSQFRTHDGVSIVLYYSVSIYIMFILHNIIIRIVVKASSSTCAKEPLESELIRTLCR